MGIAEKAEGLIRLALAEDLGVEGDVTTRSIFDEEAAGKGIVLCKEPCVLAGQAIAGRVFELAGPGADYEALADDGTSCSSGDEVARVTGSLATILAGERTALNFLCHLSGIATVTARLVALVGSGGVDLMDTRKTTPGFRVLEKYAVECGGGTNHRFGLYDGVIIKDNHIAAAGGLEPAVRRVRNALGETFPVEVEASNLAQVREALDSGADIIMLDNMEPGKVARAVAMVGGRARVEVSGGVNAENLPKYTQLGVDAVSLGSITHSAPAVDMSLEIEPE